MTEFRCKDCKHDKGKCVGATRRGWHKNCFEPKVMTNADRIRAMTDEELAELLEEMTYDSMEHRAEYWLEWLKQPAEVDHG